MPELRCPSPPSMNLLFLPLCIHWLVCTYMCVFTPTISISDPSWFELLPQSPSPCLLTRRPDPTFLQDPFRIEVPVYLEDALRIDPGSLGDPFPCKPDGCSAALASPAGLADDPIGLASALGGSTTTFSEPNSATSSLTWFDPELRIASRQSSDNDLGPWLSYSSRSDTQDEGQDVSSQHAYGETVEAITLFDQGKCTGLTSVKTPRPDVFLGKEPTHGNVANPKMLPVYQNLKNDMGDGARVPGLVIRPTRVHSNTLPQPRNQYDLSALLAQFKLDKTKSPAAGARPPSPHRPIVKSSSSSGSNCVARPQPRHYLRTVSAPVTEDEPRAMVMIPGMSRKL